MYDSYNVEIASKRIKSVRVTNFTEINNLTNEKKNMQLIIYLKDIFSTSNL